MRKSELLELQKAARPFGGLAAATSGRRAAGVRVARGRSTSPRARARDYWRLARALFAAGFRPGDLVHNCFSYHLTPARRRCSKPARMRWAARCFRAASARPSMQVQAIADLTPAGYVGHARHS